MLIKKVLLWKQSSYSEAQISILELIQGNKGPTVLYVHVVSLHQPPPAHSQPIFILKVNEAAFKLLH